MKSADNSRKSAFASALWRIYNRPGRPIPWAYGGNLPYDDPAFSERMLQEHLDPTHGAASRTAAERTDQINWLWEKLPLKPDSKLLDVTCGPGLYAVELAQRGVEVTGVDFAPAALRYAQNLAQQQQVSQLCHFIQADVRGFEFGVQQFDAALLLYGQLAVMSRPEAAALLAQIAQSLRPGGQLVLELLNPEQVDKQNSSWWFTDDKGLWGSAPFLHLGERLWLAEEQLSLERYFVVQLDTGQMDEIILCDQVYQPAEMSQMLTTAGFGRVEIYPAWDKLPLYDAAEWLVYVAQCVS